MISVAEADSLLAGFRDLWPSETVPLREAAGRILREDVRADRAYPAQDRSRMDGVAIAFSDWERGAREFPVAGLARAGEPRVALPRPGSCVEIMTGAAVPEGADAVIPYEDLEIAGGVARAKEGASVRRGGNVHPRGSDCAEGDVLVPAGVRLDATHVAIAASVGKVHLAVARKPRVAVVTTGDELVEVSAVPEAHQLRASNGPALAALLSPWAEVAETRCGDEPEKISEALAFALSECDVLLVTGGVSAGKFDLVPDALVALGVEKVFHKIAQKPGKPLWFGAKVSPSPASRRAEGGALVFGLPGNPVSSLVCARRYVLPLLCARSGWNPPVASAVFEGALAPSRLTRFVPVRMEEIDGIRRVREVPLNGSGDFSGFGGADGFVEVPVDAGSAGAGKSLSFYPWFS